MQQVPGLGLQKLIPTVKVYNATNVDDWIDTIRDNEDKRDILAWANRVKNKQMSREKFRRRIAAILFSPK